MNRLATILLLGFISRSWSIDACPRSIQYRKWGSIRIVTHVYDEETLRRDRPQLAEAIIDRVLPVLTHFWSSAMRVRNVRGKLHVSRDCRGVNGDCMTEAATSCVARGGYGVKIPDTFFSQQRVIRPGAYGRMKAEVLPAGAGVDADMILLVSVDERGRCAPGLNSGVIAEAFSCRQDSCGRPIMGVIHICPRGTDPSSQASVTSLYDTLAHEMTHTFGFTSDNFHQMRYLSGAPRIPLSARRTVRYTCKIDPATNLPKVKWNIQGNPDPDNTYTYTFPVGIVSAVKTRGGVGSSSYGCDKCPSDPKKKYSSKDIEKCLSNLGKCSFAISTPRVVETVREFFDCPSLQGAELDNRIKQPSCSFFDSHWKQRLFGDEYMTPSVTGGAQFISPVTFAFLEDLGWYKMDYSKTTPLIQGAHWGYKEGCNFVNNQCINEHGNPVQALSEKFFCNGRNVYPVCSANTLHKVVCDTTTNKDNLPELYRYPVNGKSSRYDYCPVYFPKRNTFCHLNPNDAAGRLVGEVLGDSSRCLDQLAPGDADTTHLQGMCFKIDCVDLGRQNTTHVPTDVIYLAESSDETSDVETIDSDDTSDDESDTDTTSDDEDDTTNVPAYNTWGYFVSYTDTNGTVVRITNPCKEHGQTISYSGGSIICSNPALICSKHIAPHMGLNLSPFGNPAGARRAGSWAGQPDAQRPHIVGENGEKTIKASLEPQSSYITYIITLAVLVLV